MQAEKIKKLILFRLLFATVLLYCPAAFPGSPAFIFYAGAVAICALSGAYLVWLIFGRRLVGLASVQVILDLLIETALICHTGGPESPFVIFYVLSILSSALVIERKGGILITSVLASLAYAAISVRDYLSQFQGSSPADAVYFYYGTVFRIVIFFTVGHLSRYLSERIQHLEKLVKLSERLSLLGEVASKIAHEVRNPLSSIRTAAEVLRDSLKGRLNPQEARMIQIVDGESERLTQTLERILSYARQVELHRKRMPLEDLIERVLTLARLNSRVQAEGIVVEKKYDPIKMHVYADEEQMVGAFLNLVLNAFEAMPKGGILRIRASEDVKGTTIELEDGGGGIPQEKLKDVFSPFKTTKKGGTGLGLAEVQKVITLHEGKIEVKSHSGKGTIFHLFLPKP